MAVQELLKGGYKADFLLVDMIYMLESSQGDLLGDLVYFQHLGYP